jgi:hypothetical protein
MEQSRWPEPTLIKPPSVASTALGELYEDYICQDTLDTKPPYQRNRFRHNEEFVTGLLTTIMISGVIMPILLYKIQQYEIKRLHQHKWEVIDGVHRITTISCFMNGTYIKCEKNKKIMPYIFNETTKEYILYNKTTYTEEWRNFPENTKKNIIYMSDEDKYRFNNFEIILCKITSPMTLDQRREQFSNIQHNLPVRNNDLYKNCIHIPIVKIISDFNLEQLFDNVCDHLCKDITQYKINWIIRFWLFSIEHNQNCITIKDSEIKSMMERCNPSIMIIDEKKTNTFVKEFTRFCNLFEEIDANITLSPVAIYSVYDVLRKKEENVEYDTILRSHFMKLSKGETKIQRSMWEARNNTTADDLVNYFDEFTMKLLNIDNLAETDTIGEIRKPIPAKLRNAVWKKWFDNNDQGQCFCCNNEIFKKAKNKLKTWNCGHIVSDYDGGELIEENMRCVCFDCNQKMKTENLFEWKSRMYPLTISVNN